MKNKSISKGWKICFCLLLILLLARITKVIDINIVDGTSMEPTYHTYDYLICSNIAVNFGEIKAGDIVIAKPASARDGNSPEVVKRIIGVPGDHIEIKNGILKINDEIVKENYINNEKTIGEENINIVLNDEQYFIMGDNRNHSYDSRIYGPITKKEIIGIVYFQIPLSNLFS